MQIVARNQKKEQVDLIAASTAINHHMYVHHYATGRFRVQGFMV